MNEKHSDKKTDLKNRLILFAGTFIVGCIMSGAYFLILPYTLSDNDRYSRASILALFLLSSGTGLIIRQIKIRLKINDAAKAAGVVLLGCVCFNYFKWALFLENDSREFINNDDYESYEEFCEYLDRTYTNSKNEPYSDAAIAELAKIDYTDFNVDNPREAAIIVIETLNNSSRYGYHCDMRYLKGKKPSTLYYMFRPTAMFERIGQINYERRWVFGETRYESSLGLTACWIGEFLLICCITVVTAIGSGRRRYLTRKVLNRKNF